jgi:hypothetical protein
MADQAKSEPRPLALENEAHKRADKPLDKAFERTETSAAALGARTAEAGEQAARSGEQTARSGAQAAAQMARTAENTAGSMIQTAMAETQEMLDAATRLNGIAYRSFQSMASVWTDYLRGEMSMTGMWGLPRPGAEPEQADPARRARRLFDASAQIVQISSDCLGEAATLFRESSRRALDHARTGVSAR